MLEKLIEDKSIRIKVLTPTDETAVGVYFVYALKQLGYNNVNTINFRNYDNWKEQLNGCDLFLLCKGYGDAFNNRQLITAIKKTKIPCILFYPDDMHTFDLCRVLARNFEYTFHFSSTITKKLKEESVHNIETLNFAYDGRYFYPRVCKEYKYDIAFCGSIYGERKNLIKKIGEKYDISILQLNNNDHAEEISKAKLVFNHCIGQGLNMRVFETMACGRPMLCEKKDEMGELGFIAYTHYIIYPKDNMSQASD